VNVNDLIAILEKWDGDMSVCVAMPDGTGHVLESADWSDHNSLGPVILLSPFAQNPPNAIHSLELARARYADYVQEVKPFPPVDFAHWLRNESSDHCQANGAPCYCEVCWSVIQDRLDATAENIPFCGEVQS
jgi:hypothetical protein